MWRTLVFTPAVAKLPLPTAATKYGIGSGNLGLEFYVPNHFGHEILPVMNEFSLAEWMEARFPPWERQKASLSDQVRFWLTYN